jgi:hypothetical protein
MRSLIAAAGLCLRKRAGNAGAGRRALVRGGAAIYWSAKDTRTTKEQAERENSKWKRLCGDQARAAAGE